MKFKKILVVLTIVSMGQLLVTTSNTTVQAAQIEKPKLVTNKAWTKKLAKAGYVLYYLMLLKVCYIRIQQPRVVNHIAERY